MPNSLTRGKYFGEHFLNSQSSKGITSQLTQPGRVENIRFKLIENSGKAFNGSKIYGQGFLLSPENAKSLISQNQKNKEILFPYLNGEDLNTRYDYSIRRWAINFFDWPLSHEDDDPKKPKGPPYASDYPECFKIVQEKVKPERDKNKRKERRERWWQYGEKCPGLYTAIDGLNQQGNRI